MIHDIAVECVVRCATLGVTRHLTVFAVGDVFTERQQRVLHLQNLQFKLQFFVFAIDFLLHLPQQPEFDCARQHPLLQSFHRRFKSLPLIQLLFRHRHRLCCFLGQRREEFLEIVPVPHVIRWIVAGTKDGRVVEFVMMKRLPVSHQDGIVDGFKNG